MKGWGQEQLAEKMDVSGGAVGNWESGDKPPSAKNLGKLSALLGVSTEWLVYGEEKSNSCVVPSTGALLETRPVYRVNEEASATPEDEITREKCKEHFDQFLSTCDTRSKLGWLWCELLDKFPLNKFKRKDES